MLHWLKPVAKTSPGSSGTNVIYTIKSLCFADCFQLVIAHDRHGFILLNNKLDSKMYLTSSSKCQYILNILLFSFSLPFDGVKYQVIYLLSSTF